MWGPEQHYLYRSRNSSNEQQPDGHYVQHNVYNGKRNQQPYAHESDIHHDYGNYDDRFYHYNSYYNNGRCREALSDISRCSIHYSLYYTPPIVNKQSSNIS